MEDKAELFEEGRYGRPRPNLAKTIQRNPLFPIGVAGTVAAFALGMRNMGGRADGRLSVMAMSGRIAAQTFTVAIMLPALYFAIKRREEEASHRH